MGRARGSAGVSNFNQVLGSGRGVSANTWAHRDAEELRTTKLLRVQAIEAAFERGYGERIAIACGSRASADHLANACHLDREMPEVGVYSTLTKTLAERALASDVALQELTVISGFGALGEPEGCPWFAQPAVQALAQYFADVEDDELKDRHAIYVIQGILSPIEPAQPLAYYEYLQPLCESLAAVLVKSSSRGDLPVAAARALEGAPSAALSGPLRSWADAFNLRLKRDGSVRERAALEKVFWMHNLDAEFKLAFAEVEEELSKLSSQALAQRLDTPISQPQASTVAAQPSN
jgi:hypothetical protein